MAIGKNNTVKKQKERIISSKEKSLQMMRLLIEFIWRTMFGAKWFTAQGEIFEELNNDQVVDMMADFLISTAQLKSQLEKFFCNGNTKKFRAMVLEKMQDETFMNSVFEFEPMFTQEDTDREFELIRLKLSSGGK